MKNTLPKTWQELKEQMIEGAKNAPDDLVVTCICGKPAGAAEMSDEDYQNLFKILQDV